MNILVLGSYSPEAQQNDADFGGWLERGGAEVFRFDPESAYLAGGIDHLERTLARQIEANRVEVVLYGLGMEFDFRPAFFRSLPRNVLTVLLVGDDEHYFDVSHRYYGQAFDLVMTINPLNDRYRIYGMDAVFLPTAFSSATYYSVANRPKTVDVSFVGAMHGKIGRAEYARALANADLAFRAYGAGTAGGTVTRAQAIDIYRSSKINLNFTGTSVTTPLDAGLAINRRTRQMKGRPVQIALCGSFVLSEYSPGIERIFEIGREIDVFHDEAELLDKTRFYLEHESRRELMAAAAHARAVSQYDDAVVGKTMVKTFASRLDSRRQRDALPLCIDAVFQSGFGAWRWYYIAQAAVRGRLPLLAREIALLIRTGRCNLHAAIWFFAMGLHAAARTSRLAAALERFAKVLRHGMSRAVQK